MILSEFMQKQRNKKYAKVMGTSLNISIGEEKHTKTIQEIVKDWVNMKQNYIMVEIFVKGMAKEFYKTAPTNEFWKTCDPKFVAAMVSDIEKEKKAAEEAAKKKEEDSKLVPFPESAVKKDDGKDGLPIQN